MGLGRSWEWFQPSSPVQQIIVLNEPLEPAALGVAPLPS